MDLIEALELAIRVLDDDIVSDEKVVVKMEEFFLKRPDAPKEALEEFLGEQKAKLEEKRQALSVLNAHLDSLKTSST